MHCQKKNSAANVSRATGSSVLPNQAKYHFLGSEHYLFCILPILKINPAVWHFLINASWCSAVFDFKLPFHLYKHLELS